MPTVAVLYAGDARNPAAWSGTPSGIVGGLEAVGVTVRAIDMRIDPRVERRLVRASLTLHPELCRLRSRLRRRDVRDAERSVDGLIQIGTDFTISTTAPTVTYEDMTVAQHIEHADEWFMTFPARARDAWLARQRLAYRNADACCVCSGWAGGSIVQHYGVAATDVRVVGLGANHRIDPPNDRDWSLPRFLCVARDWRRKNVPLIVETFARVRAEHPSSTLDIVGPYPGPAGDGVTLHGTLRLDEPGERAQVESLFRRATCYVMPSKHEASALAFIEAGSAGLPSIGTTVGGAAELIGDGGVVVDPADPEALHQAMLRLSDPETGAAFGARARAHSAWYQWPATAERILDALGVAVPRPA